MKFIPQHDQMDCGPACLAMVASKYGKNYSLQYLRENSFLTREGVSLLGISEASKKIGMETLSAKLDKKCFFGKIFFSYFGSSSRIYQANTREFF